MCTRTYKEYMHKYTLIYSDQHMSLMCLERQKSSVIKKLRDDVANTRLESQVHDVNGNYGKEMERRHGKLRNTMAIKSLGMNNKYTDLLFSVISCCLYSVLCYSEFVESPVALYSCHLMPLQCRFRLYQGVGLEE